MSITKLLGTLDALKWEDEQLRRWVDTVIPRSDYSDRHNPQEASFGEYLSSKFMFF